MAIGCLVLALAAAGQTPAAAPVPAEQRLQPGDLIEVAVFQAPELATTARLDADGAITMPEVGAVALGGRTAAEAEQVLQQRLAASYLLAPQVHLTVRDFAPQPVSVLGAVKAPGIYSARSYPTLAAMLAAAGGLEAPENGRIEVFAAHPATPPVVYSPDDLARGAGAAVRLVGGDVVRVSEAASVYVGGEVAKPGAYTLPAGGLTLVEALSLAGGVGREGRLDQARIVHRGADGSASVQWVNAGPILAGRRPDLALRPLDLVYIPHSAGRAAMIHGLQTVVATGSAIISGVIIFH